MQYHRRAIFDKLTEAAESRGDLILPTKGKLRPRALISTQNSTKQMPHRVRALNSCIVNHLGLLFAESGTR